MPALTPLGLPYPLPTDPLSLGANDIRALAEAIDGKQAYFGSTPPSSPVAGSEWIFPAGGGVLWHFRYNPASSSSYKWEFIGGSPYEEKVDAGANTASTSYADLGGPGVSAPRAGDWLVTFGAVVMSPTLGFVTYTSLAIGATAATDALAAEWGPTAASHPNTIMRSVRLDAVAASALVALRYKVSANNATWFKRWIHLAPIRVA